MSDTATYEVPSHVPPELVRDVDFPSLPGSDDDPVGAMATLHSGPDIIWAPRIMRGQPAWIVTRYSLLKEILQDPASFSSSKFSGFETLIEEELDLVPVEIDPPAHSHYRALLNPYFSPKRLAMIDQDIRRLAEELVEAALAKGECDFANDFGGVFPVVVFLSMMGLPQELRLQFQAWEDGLLHGPDFATRSTAAKAIGAYLQEVIDERRKEPKDDLVSLAVTAQIEGRPLTNHEAKGICYTLFAGGLDSVAAMLSFSIKHMAQNPSHQQLLRDKPELRPGAIQEYFRLYAPTTAARRATRDVDFHGVHFRKGDWILTGFGLSGRDDNEFPNANIADYKRDNSRHFAFGSGPHRCLGAHLAKREMQIAFDLWLTRVPPFRIKPGEKPIVCPRPVFGVEYLPLVW